MMARPFSADTLSQLRDLIGQDALRVPNKDAALAYLDLAEDALGREFHAGPYAKTQDAFETRFPEAPDEGLAASFGDERLYQKWRRNVLKFLCFAGAAGNTDPFLQLSIFARREGFEAPLRPVFNEAFPGRHPHEICREEALEIDQRLLGRDRQRFRRAMGLLDRLRAIKDVRNAGLLRPDPIGPFPLYRENSRERVKLPPGLAVLMEGQTGADARCVRRIFEIAVDAGILDEFADIAPLHLAEKSILVKIHQATWAVTTKPTADAYLRCLLHLLRKAMPEALPAQLRVPDLRPGRRLPRKPVQDAAPQDRSKAHGDNTNDTLRDSEKRSGREPFPDFVRSALSDYHAATGAPKSKMKLLRTALRRLDAERPTLDLHGLVDDADSRMEALFANCTERTRANYRSALRSFLVHMGLADDWTLLNDRAGHPGMPVVCGRGLAELRRLSTRREPPLVPGDISSEVALNLIEEAREEGARGAVSRLRQGFAALDLLRSHMPDLLPPDAIGPLPDARRRDNLDLPAAHEAALEAHAREAGFTPAGTRAMLVAVRKLYTLASDRSAFDTSLDQIPFDTLLNIASETDPVGIAPYRKDIASLAERLQTPWSPGWRKLQACVVSAGVRRADSPIEALVRLAVPDGLEPWQIDREWAWTHERGLRPDLRVTFARNIERFDALHTHDMIIDAQLLPPQPLGPMPRQGERLRNAVYPLPSLIERALEGESKPLLEAAHFVWRTAREIGLWRRGDAPTPADLFSEVVLRRIADEGGGRSVQIVRKHLAYIRDWKDSGLDHPVEGNAGPA
ncbi:hypothetical protein [Aquicoccus sp. SU-CL01552]|uniref:hypothetical protein n=1 Tax=Aquicoccus sp. SU-CL01552 TaxID=3127656 RepID=UPI0031062C02